MYCTDAGSVGRETFLQHLSSLTDIGLRTLHEELGPVIQEIAQRKKRSQQRQRRRIEREREKERRVGNRDESSSRSGKNDQNPETPSDHPYDFSKLRPGYEKEIIRLMLRYGRDMIDYIGSNFSDQYFEDDQLRTFYLDIIQRFKDEVKVTVEHYASREHPYPHLVGEIMLEKHDISERHREMVGVQYERDQNPFLSAKSALKTALLEFINRKQQELQKDYDMASEEQRRTIIRQMKEIAEQRTRLQKLPFDKLFPDPENVSEEHIDDNIFQYEMKK